jgi:hypothetical protein
MSGVTDNYGFILVEEGESYDEEIFNTNNKTADAQLKVNADAVKKIKHAEFTGGASSFPASAAQWGTGVLTVDNVSVPNVIHNNSFVAYESSDTIKILETGLYLFQWQLYSTSLPPNGEIVIKNVTTGVNVIIDDLSKSLSWTVPVTGAAFVSANDKISFFTQNRAAAFSGSSRIKVTKLQG